MIWSICLLSKKDWSGKYLFAQKQFSHFHSILQKVQKICPTQLTIGKRNEEISKRSCKAKAIFLAAEIRNAGCGKTVVF
jgi:hypothetical protein